jgi:hypothetical protein
VLSDGSVPQHLAHCYNENCLDDEYNRREFIRALKDELGSSFGTFAVKAELLQEDVVERQATALPESIPLNSSDCPLQVSEYVKGRGFDVDELATEWGVRVGFVPIHEPYPSLIIPVEQHGVYRGFQARRVGEAGPGPKYYTKFAKSEVLYNFDRARHAKRIILVEGVTDVWKAGKNSVAIFGKKPSAMQEEMLLTTMKNRELIWLPDANDPESVDVAARTIPVWRARGVFSRIMSVVLPEDPGSNSLADILSAIEEATCYDK